MPSITLGEIQAFVYDRVENNTLLYTLPELDAAINEAVRVIGLFTGFAETTLNLTGFTVADQLLYSTPSPILFPTRIAFEGRDLDKIGLRRISQDCRYWVTDNSTTYGPVARWVPIGISQFALHPMDAVGGNDVTITGVIEPTLLVNTSDVMALDDEFVTMIVDYAAHRLVLKEGGKVFTDSSMLIQQFWRQMKQLKRWQGFKAPRYFIQVQEPS